MNHASKITTTQIQTAQQAWGDGIVGIAAAHADGKDFEAVARTHVTTHYAYGLMPVLFKPTMAADVQFRTTFDEALSYFVATNGRCPEDTGFAIKGWTSVRFENVDLLTHGGTAMAMGNYFFTRPDGTEAKVEFSFCYIQDTEGKLRIHLHHSSVPVNVN